MRMGLTEIVVVVLILLGAILASQGKKLPELAKNINKSKKILKEESTDEGNAGDTVKVEEK